MGTDPDTGGQINLRIGRSWVYVEVEGHPDRRATLPVDLLIDELTEDKVVELIRRALRADEPLCRDEETGKNIYAKVGPFGPYLQLGEPEGDKKPKRVSLGKGTDITTIDLEYALQAAEPAPGDRAPIPRPASRCGPAWAGSGPTWS